MGHWSLSPRAVVVVVIVQRAVIVAPCRLSLLCHCASSSRHALSLCPLVSSHAVVVIVTSPCIVVVCAASSLAVLPHPALSCRWIRRHHLPPSSSLRCLRHRAVGCHCRGAIGRHRHAIFTLLGPPLLPLCVGMPCTCLVVPLCHPAASICIIAPLCAAIVIVHSARALHGWHLFSGAVPGPWACQWGGGEGTAGAPCMWRVWLSLLLCTIVAVVGSSSRMIDIMRLCTMPGHCSLVEGG